VYSYNAFNAEKTLKNLETYKVTSLCAPLSVWKLFAIQNISTYKLALKKIVSAGEPLNPEIVNKVKELFALDLYEGYGQTETTLLVGTFLGMKIKPGAMGRVSPGYEVKLVNEHLDEVPQGQDGQIAVVTSPTRPLGLLIGYDDELKNKEIFKGALYLTGDTAFADEQGYLHFIGRTDDVFKSLDYRISPFEVESEIMEHQAVMEVGIIPVIDERERTVPKAFVVLKPDYLANKQMALELFRFIRDNMAPYKRPRSIEFMNEFPKTISAKVMRRELRSYELELKDSKTRGRNEYYESDFAEELNIQKRG
jgi:acetyl-CoA synthetase